MNEPPAKWLPFWMEYIESRREEDVVSIQGIFTAPLVDYMR